MSLYLSMGTQDIFSRYMKSCNIEKSSQGRKGYDEWYFRYLNDESRNVSLSSHTINNLVDNLDKILNTCCIYIRKLYASNISLNNFYSCSCLDNIISRYSMAPLWYRNTSRVMTFYCVRNGFARAWSEEIVFPYIFKTFFF